MIWKKVEHLLTENNTLEEDFSVKNRSTIEEIKKRAEKDPNIRGLMKAQVKRAKEENIKPKIVKPENMAGVNKTGTGNNWDFLKKK